VSGALEALRAAMESGDVQALAPAYARNAVLDAGLPGGRVRHLGRAAIVDELGRWWDEPAQVGEWTVRSWPTGAALTVERDGVRRRHYLHLSGDLIARHWIYAMAPRPGRDATVPGEVLAALGDGARREAAAFAGNSGAGIERVLLGDGTALIMKRVVAGGDWLGRATGGRARTAELWHAGVLARVPPEIDHAIVTVLPDPVEGWWVAMRDVSAAMLGDERRLSRDESRRVLAAAAALHAAFAGESVEELCPLADRLVATSGLRVADDEREGTDLLPKQCEAAWDAFAEAADADVGEAVLSLVRDPAPLAAALEATGPLTLCHGDLRDDNLGFDGDHVVLLDWDIATQGTAAVELAWYLCHDAWRIDATRDDVVADFLSAEDGAVGPEALDLGLISGLVQYGWIFGHSALVHPDPAEREWAREELAWWVPRVRDALERSWSSA
jgi:Phosphotransferase enzyme family